MKVELFKLVLKIQKVSCHQNENHRFDFLLGPLDLVDNEIFSTFISILRNEGCTVHKHIPNPLNHSCAPWQNRKIRRERIVSSSKDSLRFASWNINGIKSKKVDVSLMMEQTFTDVLLLQETD